MEWTKEYRSVEPMNDERSVKMTDKRVAWCKAELANAKTAEVSEAAAEVAEAAAAEMSEAPTAETMATTAEAMATTTTKAHQRCCRKVR